MNIKLVPTHYYSMYGNDSKYRERKYSEFFINCSRFKNNNGISTIYNTKKSASFKYKLQYFSSMVHNVY